MRNILRDGRVSLILLVAGSTTCVRINGTARLTADPGLCAGFVHDGQHPRTVIVIRVGEVYSQCARALQRSELWTAGDWAQDLPIAGRMLQDATRGRAHLGRW